MVYHYMEIITALVQQDNLLVLVALLQTVLVAEMVERARLVVGERVGRLPVQQQEQQIVVLVVEEAQLML
ncbi:MAG: hypothetical protein IID15_06980, partial [Candidatus Marinimicrobia bacterium]|nr:hypothetical protein [Candidatus Neomarinimicrobiota bacterium]